MICWGKKIEKKENKQYKTTLHAEKHKGEFYQISTTVLDVTSTSSDSNEPIMHIKSPRQCTLKEKTEVGTTSSTKSQEDSSTDSNDEEWNLPLRFERSLTKKPETVTLTLPSKKIPELLAGTSTVTKTSARNKMKLGIDYFQSWFCRY